MSSNNDKKPVKHVTNKHVKFAPPEVFRHQRRCECFVSFSVPTMTTADGIKVNQKQGDVAQLLMKRTEITA